MNDARMIWNRHAGWLAGSVLFLVSLASADVLVVDAAGGGSFTDLQPAIVEDITEMAIGHLNAGLLKAHGLDEGGLPEEGIGGHDAMWFAARDLALGPRAHPDTEPPERIGRPETGDRLMPEIEAPIESLLSFLMNLLIIEFRAEIGFATTQDPPHTRPVRRPPGRGRRGGGDRRAHPDRRARPRRLALPLPR